MSVSEAVWMFFHLILYKFNSLYLRVDDGGHPVALAGPGNGQHGPEEYGGGKDQGDAGGRHHVVDDDDEVAQHLRVGHQHVVEGVAELEDQRLFLVEFIRLF